MPHVEVLPNSTSVRAPGYALVPDTGRGTFQAPAQQTSGKKRAASSLGLAGGDTTVRQQNAVLKHLAELDKDSHRDVQIPVPKDNAGRGEALKNLVIWDKRSLTLDAASKKTTLNVRRILMSQKTFANHLADEEAAIAQQHTGMSTATSRSKPIPNQKRASTSELQAIPGCGASGNAPRSVGGLPPPATRDPLDDDLLLKSYVPVAPSEEVMEALLSAPPLSYNAARAGLPPTGKPQRQFCEICVYWGTFNCMKCGAIVCWIEFKGAHDDGRCLKFYA